MQLDWRYERNSWVIVLVLTGSHDAGGGYRHVRRW